MGLLYLASSAAGAGFRVSYIDCLNRFHPQDTRKQDPAARFGRGPYRKQQIGKPPGLGDVPRRYSRYGIKPAWFQRDLEEIDRPDIVFVSTMMTYWYPGVVETIQRIRAVYPDAPVIAGGIYTTIYPDHAAATLNADHIVSGPAEIEMFRCIEEYTGVSTPPPFSPNDLDARPYPAYHLENPISCIPIRTSVGCPYSCDYCASKHLAPERICRDPKAVADEIEYWHKAHGALDFVFYDDALLIEPKRHAIPLFVEIASRHLHLRFHTPNAVHVRGIHAETARLMRKIGFTGLRLGLETVSVTGKLRYDRKTDPAEFERAVGVLQAAGFSPAEIGAYLLAGLPGQGMEEVATAGRWVLSKGIRPILVWYSPIPGTKLWPSAVAASRYDLESDPVYTNNAVFPCRNTSFSWETQHRLKSVFEGNPNDE